MIIQDFFLVFLFTIYLLSMCCCVSNPVPTSGPFKTTIVSIKDCNNPTKPYLKNPPIFFYPLIHNTDGKNLFSGNITILRDTKDVKITIKAYGWRNGQWRLYHTFNNLNCHGLVIRLTFAAIGLKYDKKDCMFSKGIYPFNNMDLNQMQHIWVSSLTYGRLLWRTETFLNSGTIVCKEFDTNTEPA